MYKCPDTLNACAIYIRSICVSLCIAYIRRLQAFMTQLGYGSKQWHNIKEEIRFYLSYYCYISFRNITQIICCHLSFYKHIYLILEEVDEHSRTQIL